MKAPRDVVRKVVAQIAELRGVTFLEIMSPARQRGDKHVSQARQLAMWVCIEVLGLSARSTAMRIGERDHTTALYAMKAVRERRQRQPEYLAMTESLRTIFTAETLAARASEQAAAAMVVAHAQRRENALRAAVARSAEKRLGLWTDEQLQSQNSAFAAAMRGAGHD